MSQVKRFRKIWYCSKCAAKRGWPHGHTTAYGVYGSCDICRETHTLYAIDHELIIEEPDV